MSHTILTVLWRSTTTINCNVNSPDYKNYCQLGQNFISRVKRKHKACNQILKVFLLTVYGLILNYYLNITFYNAWSGTVGANVSWMLSILNKCPIITISNSSSDYCLNHSMVLRYSHCWAWHLSITHLIFKGESMVKSFKHKSIILRLQPWWWSHI